MKTDGLYLSIFYIAHLVWVYAEDVDRFVSWDAWEKYAMVFPTVWGAAAFKGAFGETLTIPPVSRHADNVQRWIEVVKRESPKWEKGIGGIVSLSSIKSIYYKNIYSLCKLNFY
jgi:hypothetical protein